MADEFNITVIHTTSGKEIVLAIEPQFTISSILEVLSENLQLKDRFVLANKDNKILSPDLSVKDAGLKQGEELLLMPDPTGGYEKGLAQSSKSTRGKYSS